MNLKLKKLALLFAIIFCVVNGLFADDWEATIYDNERLEKANDTVKSFIEKNGTYLSGTDDFSLYFIRNVNIYSDSIDDKGNDNVVISIVYKGQAYYHEFSVYGNYESGKLDYSVISANPPIIYLNYVSYSNLNKVIISFDGSGFVMNTIDCRYVHYDMDEPSEFRGLISIPYKYAYLQGKKILSINGCKNVYSQDEDRMYDTNYNYRFFLIGVDGDYYENDIYFQTYITDDNLRLRTSNSKNGSVIKHLNKGTLVRILNIDPARTQMEGKYGFWVLVETSDSYIGWIWSNYLNKFDYDSTNHYSDRPVFKSW